MGAWRGKVVLVTGGSRGLGLAVACAAARQGARVALCARQADILHRAAQHVRETAGQGDAPVRTSIPVAGQDTPSHEGLYDPSLVCAALPADAADAAQMQQVVDAVLAGWGRLDAVVHCVGRSDRGTAHDTSPQAFRELWEINFLTAVHCVQAARTALEASRGSLVLIGSLASKMAGLYLGAYPASKFALAAYAQQLRLELAARGVHVLLVCPGPIRREDAGVRYAAQAAGLPPAAAQPGGGVRLRGIDPHRLAQRILTACQRRQPELVVPGSARLLFALAQLSPRLGDWIMMRMFRTSS